MSKLYLNDKFCAVCKTRFYSTNKRTINEISNSDLILKINNVVNDNQTVKVGDLVCSKCKKRATIMKEIDHVISLESESTANDNKIDINIIFRTKSEALVVYLFWLKTGLDQSTIRIHFDLFLLKFKSKKLKNVIREFKKNSPDETLERENPLEHCNVSNHKQNFIFTFYLKHIEQSWEFFLGVDSIPLEYNLSGFDFFSQVNSNKNESIPNTYVE
ncbi:unnamed protein product [Brachionus calyciflorus]|uniref:Uncharacterized protein n=1 Tax=Brachionus calyciflorus TaxID=104777 RepID=A0A814FVZ0_9BILA|nr:unnamed protein product [Brachionus calyciflorus]